MLWDLGTLTYARPEPTRVIVSAPGFPELLVVSVPKVASDREAVFIALDHVLGQARVPEVGGMIPVGLYNPLSADIAVGATPNTTTYGDGEPIALPHAGLIASVENDLLTVDDRVLLPRVTSWASVAASVGAHH